MSNCSLIFRGMEKSIFEIIEMSIAVAAEHCQDELVRRRDGIVKSLYSFPSVATSGGRPEEEEKQQQQPAAGGSGKEGSIVVNAQDVDVACSQKSFLEDEADELLHAIDDSNNALADKVRQIKKILNDKNEKVDSKLSSSGGPEEDEKQQQQQTACGRSGKEGSVVVDAQDVDAASSRKSFLEEEADELQVRQIKKILDNKKEEGFLLGLLRCLQSMKLRVSTLVATGIEKSVRGVERHRSARVRQLARTVLDDWATLSSDSSNITKAITDNIRDTLDTAVNPWDDLWPNFPPLDEGALRAIYCQPFDLDELFSENSRESHKSKKDNVKRAAEARSEERKQENDCENLKPNCAQDSASGKRKCEDAIDQSEPMSRSIEPHNTPSKRIKVIITSSKTSGKELKKLAETAKKDNCELANESSSTATKKTPKQCPIDKLLIEEKLEGTRVRIHEAYNRAKEAKQQRRIQLLDLRDIPKPVESMKSSKSKARRGHGFSNRWRR